MGWLDNSTNNIILDAVLTDFGRQALAKNNGSFNIVKYSLGDDEINYQIIKKYGRTIGREKIEKNTPIFEALTNQNLALKHKLISNPAALLYLPKFTLTSSSSTPLVQNGVQQAVEFELKNSDNSELDDSLADANVDIYYPSLFLTINAQTPSLVSLDMLRTAHTIVPMKIINTISRTCSITIKSKALNAAIFTTYGRTVNDKETISTSIRIVGQNSGLSLTIPIDITKT